MSEEVFNPETVERLYRSIDDGMVVAQSYHPSAPAFRYVEASHYERLLVMYRAKCATMAEDDRRLLEAAYLAGITYMGCDTAHALAVEIVGLKTLCAEVKGWEQP